ncbi:hypothetical protein [Marivirga harenae]|uniref:hypothetical protein n=1 Tax=Marivirga harenae TaxID=2010992 RepID=UPI0026E05131|nr:hypothetical protein [Marivirga harenae]WKV12796.1 hypothetical protein Q3Y49_03010 [Marivirga harenae]
MKQIFVILFFSLFGLTSLAQTGGTIMDQIDPNFLNKDLLYEKGTYSSFDGDPYLFEEITEACLVLSDGKEICDVKINYDSFENSILLQEKDQEDLNYINPTFVKSFTVSGFKYVKSDFKGVQHNGYFQVLFNGSKFSLYRYKAAKLEYRDTQGNTGYSSSDKKSKYFSISENFVFVSEENVWVESRLKKLFKDLEAIDYKEVKRYVRSEDLDLENDSDIVNLMNYLEDYK